MARRCRIRTGCAPYGSKWQEDGEAALNDWDGQTGDKAQGGNSRVAMKRDPLC